MFDHSDDRAPALAAGVSVAGTFGAVGKEDSRGNQFEVRVIACFASVRTSVNGILKSWVFKLLIDDMLAPHLIESVTGAQHDCLSKFREVNRHYANY